jgi:hypothetical protein
MIEVIPPGSLLIIAILPGKFVVCDDKGMKGIGKSNLVTGRGSP